MKTESALYECTVMHHRLRPKVHRFQYRVFYLWADLDELPRLSLKLLGFNRRRLLSLWESDHLAASGQTLKDSILDFMRSGGVDTTEIASIRLLTFPRVLGYIFNPVCFYYAFDLEGRPICAVAEVTNTFHEKKRYLINDTDPRGRFRLRTPKHFYVSPFLDLDLDFNFKLQAPGRNLEIHIDDHDPDGVVLLTALTGKRRELTDTALLACFVKYPFVTLGVILRIHWQALRLWMKRLPWHSKDANPDLQLDLHPPITKP